jgi:hypothetical protein
MRAVALPLGATRILATFSAADATLLPTEVPHQSVALDARFAGRSFSEWPLPLINEHVFVCTLVHQSFCRTTNLSG